MSYLIRRVLAKPRLILDEMCRLYRNFVSYFSSYKWPYCFYWGGGGEANPQCFLCSSQLWFSKKNLNDWGMILAVRTNSWERFPHLHSLSCPENETIILFDNNIILYVWLPFSSKSSFKFSCLSKKLLACLFVTNFSLSFCGVGCVLKGLNYGVIYTLDG